MPAPKPLPPLPPKRRVKIVTPPPLSSVPSATARFAKTQAQPGKRAGASSHGLPASPYPQYCFHDSDDDQGETDEDTLYHEEGGDDDDSDKDAKLLEAKLLPIGSLRDRVAQLEDKVTALQEENATLRKQLKSTRAPESRGQDRVITRLREENEQLKHAAHEKTQQVSRIAQTITLAFREYQEANGFPSPRSDLSRNGSSESDKPVDNSSVIQVYSQFDSDSESDY